MVKLINSDENFSTNNIVNLHIFISTSQTSFLNIATAS